MWLTFYHEIDEQPTRPSASSCRRYSSGLSFTLSVRKVISMMIE
jgi:hypothetical protein